MERVANPRAAVAQMVNAVVDAKHQAGATPPSVAQPNTPLTISQASAEADRLGLQGIGVPQETSFSSTPPRPDKPKPPRGDALLGTPQTLPTHESGVSPMQEVQTQPEAPQALHEVPAQEALPPEEGLQTESEDGLSGEELLDMLAEASESVINPGVMGVPEEAPAPVAPPQVPATAEFVPTEGALTGLNEGDPKALADEVRQYVGGQVEGVMIKRMVAMMGEALPTYMAVTEVVDKFPALGESERNTKALYMAANAISRKEPDMAPRAVYQKAAASVMRHLKVADRQAKKVAAGGTPTAPAAQAASVRGEQARTAQPPSVAEGVASSIRGVLGAPGAMPGGVMK